MQFQQFSRRQPFIEAEIFRQETDLSPHVYIAGRSAEHERFPARRPDQSQQHLDRRALARPVWSKETENRAATHRQTEVADCNLVPEDFAQIPCLNSEAARLSQGGAPRST
jgi:hypothetical protein